ncbi:MAG: glycogen debranching protein GlgX [Succinivibrio sp.]
MSRLPSDIDLRLIPLGATLTEGGCYFSVWAPKAKEIYVHLYDQDEKETAKVKLQERRGCVWYGFIKNVKAGDLYALETDGAEDPMSGFYFKRGRLLADPYAKALSKPFIYTLDDYLNHNADFMPKAVIPSEDFDWQGTQKPSIGRDGLIIYEANVKGLTKLNPKVPEKLRGKFLGVCHSSVIEHLLELGITAIQLNPIASFISEPFLTKKGLVNYWGYNPVCFMAPDPRYAVDPKNSVNEFKTMVRELHKHGIAVILDVVFNHTGEGGLGGPVLSLKGFDAHNYYAYQKKEDGSPEYSKYYDVTGCGNTVNADSRPTLSLILDSLVYWVDQMHVDGFRFDLGVTVCRETHGDNFLQYDRNCAFLKSCFCIDSLASAIMIAEPWDIGPEGYRLGQFPVGWSEQNDKFRDTVRRFWRGDRGIIGNFATRVMGSRDVFFNNYRSINASVNFVTYHDGFTLEDLVSYTKKNNFANGEGNADGSDENFSSNCGAEGPTDDPSVLEKRWLLKRNLIATTLISQGVPHLLYGDEFSRTQNGNNNAYCQDNEISWLKWDFSEKNKNFIKFIGRIAKMRRSSKVLRELTLFDDYYHLNGTSYEAKWHQSDGSAMTAAKWNDPATDDVMLTVGSLKDDDGEKWCIIFNQTYAQKTFYLPPPLKGYDWKIILDSRTETGIPVDSHSSEISVISLDIPCILAFAMINQKHHLKDAEQDEIAITRHSNRQDKFR